MYPASDRRLRAAVSSHSSEALPFARATSRAALLVSVVLGSAIVGGCMHTGPYPGTSYVRGPQRVAVVPVPQPPRAVEMEADGLPVQLPPPRRAAPMPDDPREPWSRNYGSVPPQGGVTPQTQPQTDPRVPVDRRRASAEPAGDSGKPTVRPISATAIDAEAVIVRAIVAHEKQTQ